MRVLKEIQDGETVIRYKNQLYTIDQLAEVLEYQTPAEGEHFHLKLKYEELHAEHIRLKELYGQQQAIIEAYQKHWNSRRKVRRLQFGFER